MARGKDISPRKASIASAKQTARDLYYEKESEYWTGQVMALQKSLDEHIHTNYRKRKKDSNFTPRSLATRGISYLLSEVGMNRPLTISGLAMAMGTTTSTLFRLQKMEATTAPDKAFKDIVTKMKGFVEFHVEQTMHMKQNPTGNIFVLKNFGWQDKMEIEHSAYTGLSDEERMKAKEQLNLING